MKQKILSLLFPLLIILAVTVCSDKKTSTEPNPNELIDDSLHVATSIMDSILERVSIKKVEDFMNELTGEISVSIEGTAHVIASRKYNSEGNKLAAKYLKEKLGQLNLKVESQTYFREKTNFELTEGENIIATQEGELKDQYFLICAHYDSISPDSLIAPGADDNGSGSSAVFEAARVISEFKTKYSIIYAFFDQEEGGYQGSKIFADSVIAIEMDIKCIIELDMVGYDSNNDSRVMIWYSGGEFSSALVQKADSINTKEGAGLSFKLVEGRSLADSSPFQKAGYETLGFMELGGLSEDDPDTDMTPFYHTINDRVQTLNFEYLEKIIKLSINLLASSAGCQ